MADNFYGLTDTGRQRKNNEDSFIAQQAYAERYIIACVIDGVGGYAGGEIAAALARESILQRLSKPDGKIPALILDAVYLANNKIWGEKQRVKEHDSMACVATLAVVDMETNQFYFAHVGDTRLYLLRDGSLVKITHDQSFVGFLEDSGRLTENEAMKHPKRNEIDKALGFKNIADNNTDYIETGQSPFLPGDLILLCSDGLTDLVDRDTISHILATDASLKSKCTHLVDAANEKGGKDNITVVLVENNKAPKYHEATKPLENVKITENLSEPIVIKQTATAVLPEKKRQSTKTYKGIAVVLALVTCILLAICVWQYLNNRAMVTPPEIVDVKPLPKQLNVQEIKLQLAIANCKGKFLVLADTGYKLPIIINRAISINKDTLYIKAKGKIIFQTDSGYKGPVFTLGAKSKLITLDSLYFSNCNIAISGFNKTLSLKNVRFFNCKYPIQNYFVFDDNKYISGSLSTSVFKTDSLPQTIKPHGAR
jgi:serine/threonine protein phosphatase PrpC